MSVSAELLCSFELLKPLDSSALKSHIKKGRSKRQQMLNSPVSVVSRRLPIPLTQHSLQASSHRVFESLVIFKGTTNTRRFMSESGPGMGPATDITAVPGNIKTHRQPFEYRFPGFCEGDGLRKGYNAQGTTWHSRRENRECRAPLLRPRVGRNCLHQVQE